MSKKKLFKEKEFDAFAIAIWQMEEI